MRNLRYLDLSSNSISQIENLTDLTNLVDLNLSDNKITDISGIFHLSKLEHLNLAGNQIKALPKNMPHLFSLKIIKLARNLIENQQEILKLSCIIQLTNLSISENPIMEDGQILEYCIYHINSLDIFNDSKITPEQRKRAHDIFSPKTTSEHSPVKPLPKRPILTSAKKYQLVSRPRSHSRNYVFHSNTETTRKFVSLTKSQLEKENETVRKIQVNNSVFGGPIEILDSNIENLSIEQENTKKIIKKKLRNALNLAAEQKEKITKLSYETEKLKEILDVKNNHLAVLRKNMNEQSAESCLSDTDGFCIEEEKASSLELKELENELKEKEKNQQEIVKQMDATQSEITKLEREIEFFNSERHNLSVNQPNNSKPIIKSKVTASLNFTNLQKNETTPRFSINHIIQPKIHSTTFCENNAELQDKNNSRKLNKTVCEISENLDTPTEYQRKIFEEMHRFLVPFMRVGQKLYDNKTEWDLALAKSNDRKIFDSPKSYYFWFQTCINLLQSTLCLSYFC